MPASSPLNHLHDAAGASFLHYTATPASDPNALTAQVVESFGELEGEYAAIRKGCAIIDAPQRATIEARGDDAIDFLNRMITQELKDFEPFQIRRSLWLNRKGRIDADMRLARLPDRLLIDLDVLVADHTVRTLTDFIFSEDVTFEDLTESLHRLLLQGPTAPALLRAASEPAEGRAIDELENEGAAIITIAGSPVIVARDDETAEPGMHLFIDARAVEEVYAVLLDRGLDDPPDGATAPGPYRLRPAGWHAFNIARIEAGTPFFNIDFSASNLPAESGVLDDRVSFTKGCYLGQEVVARMKSLGHPKQTLIALRIEPPDSPETQPVTGAPIWLEDDSERNPVGAVTSSTRSPMLGDVPIAFAHVKWAHARPGVALMVDSDATPLRAEVQDQLRFWPSTSGHEA